MKIVKLQAENVKKLKAVEIAPEGNVIKISGRNEQGKTTVLDAIWWAVGGEKNIQEMPIRSGEKSASITLDLGDMLVTRTFTEAGSYLKVENKNGAQFKSPQGLLDKLIGKLSFDPLAFAKADRNKQVQTLLNVVDLQVDANRLSEIAGAKVYDSGDPLGMVKDAWEKVYQQRTLVNRDLDRAKKLLDSVPAVEKTKPVSITDLVAEKERLEAVNRSNESIRGLVKVQEVEVDTLRSTIVKIESEIAKLRDLLAEKYEKLAAESTKLENWIIEADALKDYDLTEIKSRIASADATNEQARKYAEREKLAAEVAEYQGQSNDLTGRLDSIKAYKQELIENTKFPIPGLDFGGGGILYQGIPFEQASSAQKLQVSLAIAMALNPELRVIRIDDGSLLDSKHMEIIEEMAKENDFQVWMEVVNESGTVGIYIEDGQVAAVN